MTLGIVEPAPLAPVAAAFPSLLTPFVAQGGHDSSAAAPLLPQVLSPMAILLLCIAAGVATYLLLPGRRRGPAARGAGGALMILAALGLGLLLIRYAAANSAGGVGVYFWVFSAIGLGGALRVITHPRPVYAALYFVLTVFATAGLFILLWAEFMAAALVLIYAGAILVTYVFVIMLAASTTRAGVDKVSEYDAVSRDPVVASAVGVALMGVMLFVIFDRAEPLRVGDRTYTYAATKTVGDRHIDVQGEVNAPNPALARQRIPAELVPAPGRDPEPAYSVQALGRYLFREQAVNLELAGLILTLGMVGAILIARRRVVTTYDSPAAAERAGHESFVAPATPISDDPYSIPVYGTDNPRQKAYPET